MVVVVVVVVAVIVVVVVMAETNQTHLSKRHGAIEWLKVETSVGKQHMDLN